MFNFSSKNIFKYNKRVPMYNNNIIWFDICKGIIFLVIEFIRATLFYIVLLFINNNVFNSLGNTNNYSSNRAHNENDFKQRYLFSSTKRPSLVGRVQSLMVYIYILYKLSVYVLINDFLYHRESTFLSMRTTRSNHWTVKIQQDQ